MSEHKESSNKRRDSRHIKHPMEVPRRLSNRKCNKPIIVMCQYIGEDSRWHSKLPRKHKAYATIKDAKYAINQIMTSAYFKKYYKFWINDSQGGVANDEIAHRPT